jgi:hypothetical protein
MAGLSGFGAAVAIGLVGSGVLAGGGARPAPGSPPSMAIVHMAFCLGLAVLGVVAALLAATLGPAMDGSTEGLFTAIPALAGMIAGLGILGRDREAIDARVAQIARGFLLAIGGLGVLSAIVVFSVTGEGGARPPDWPFPILGAVAAGAALGIGITGRAALEAMQRSTSEVAQLLYRRQVARTAMLDAIGVGASALAVALIVLA